MPSSFRVIITKTAATDLHEIFNYIKEHSPQNAVTMIEKIISAIDDLQTMPLRNPIAGRSRKRGSEIRKIVVRPFVVYYRVEEKAQTVTVLFVWHGARRQPRTFDE